MSHKNIYFYKLVIFTVQNCGLTRYLLPYAFYSTYYVRNISFHSLFLIWDFMTTYFKVGCLSLAQVMTVICYFQKKRSQCNLKINFVIILTVLHFLSLVHEEGRDISREIFGKKIDSYFFYVFFHAFIDINCLYIIINCVCDRAKLPMQKNSRNFLLLSFLFSQFVRILG